VVDRECENPLQETDFCPTTQYLEIASGEMFDVSDEPRVLAFWFAEQRASAEYANQVHGLRGHCEASNRYVLQRDSLGEAWLTLSNGAPVSRTPELNKRLLLERD
jgi:hypothetical protein